MKLACKILGGSHSYGLNTPESDTDYRGMFIDTEISKIIGLDRSKTQQTITEADDSVYTEFRDALRLLRGGNTQMLELLFSKDFLELGNEWKLVQEHRAALVSSERLYSCLKGYMQGELRLANGERTGKLGGKRKEAIEKYGFSPKNYCQLLRLAWAGKIFFERGYFPVNVMKEDEKFGLQLSGIKYYPSWYSKEELNEKAAQSEELLNKAFDNRLCNYQFDEKLANDICFDVYNPILINHAVQNRSDS